VESGVSGRNSSGKSVRCKTVCKIQTCTVRIVQSV